MYIFAIIMNDTLLSFIVWPDIMYGSNRNSVDFMVAYVILSDQHFILFVEYEFD